MTLPTANSLHVTHIISGLGQGGAETVLYRLLTAPNQQHRHTVISMTDQGVFGARLEAAGIEVVTLGMPSGRLTPHGLWRLYKILREQRPDVVQTWMYHADLIGGVVARLAGIRAVAWGIRNSGANLYTSSRAARAIAWLCARLSGVVPALIVSCAEEAARRHQRWGYRADRMLVIPNGYDLARWEPDGTARERVRNEWGVTPATPVLGSVARWNPLKDHKNLLEGLALAAKHHPQLRCVLVGQDMSPDNAALMALIDRLQLRDKIIMLGRREDVPAIMNALDVHVLSSKAEGFPNVVAEAMAAETACVVTRVGDAAYIVGEHGWVVEPGNPSALAEGMLKAVNALSTPQLQAQLKEGRLRVGRLFSLEAMVGAYDAAWQKLAVRFSASTKTQKGIMPMGEIGGFAHRRRLLFIVNNPAFFLSHRLPVAQAAMQAGFEVHVATMPGSTVSTIESLGITHHVLPMSRSGKNPLEELQTLYTLWKLFRGLRPDVVHAVTIKPVLYGGIAARLAKVPAYIAAVSGLGFIFIRESKGFDFLRWAATLLYRLALGHPNSRVIFQNTSDRDVLLRCKAVRPEQVVLIRGSGVDLERFRATPEPDGKPVALMVSRLLIDKGVREFVEAARLSANGADGVRWVLAGSIDKGNPASITQAELDQWLQEGVIEYLGEQEDIPALYQQAHIAVLPSYREGLPKSLIEAAACGRAVVTTDVPGCRDAIEPGVTGLLVPARDARALAFAVQRLADDGKLRQEMGEAGRRLAEYAFDVNHVADRHVELYEELTTAAANTAVNHQL